jgi:integrase
MASMRFKQPFTLYLRRLQNGTRVYYYRYYDADGRRSGGRSTGQAHKALALKYVLELIKSGRLDSPQETTFGSYAENWWVWGKCSYLESQATRGQTLSRRYAEVQRGFLVNHVLPEFEKLKLSAIKPYHIEKWLKILKDSGLSSASVQHCYGVLRLMMSEAKRLGYLAVNPVEAVKPIHLTQRVRGILSLDEARQLFDENKFSEYWQTEIGFTCCLVAATSGAREGECIALRTEDIFDGFVRIQHSWDHKFGLKETKTKQIREVPIPAKTQRWLSRLTASRPAGFVFSTNNGASPVYYKPIVAELYEALNRMGISENERKLRNVTFHSFRHFFNSALRGKVPDAKLQRLTGHQTQQMVERYTHFRLDDFQDVRAIQEELAI